LEYLSGGPAAGRLVGQKFKGNVAALGPSKTEGIDASNGDVKWSIPGDYECTGTLEFLASQVTCQFTGSLTESTKHLLAPTLHNVTLKLNGFDPTTGAITWTLPVTNVKPFILGIGLKFADGSHLLVTLKNGTTVLLDTDSGKTSTVGSHQVLWCQTTKIFKVSVQSGTPAGKQRITGPLSYPCNAQGKTSSSLPADFPSSVGVTINGIFIWASPTGLRTHQMAGG
jgi:hypothetical protein